ncbi:class I SAM-dependent methyltransferase [Leptothoe kymatousa]|uniref:Class I SAM-dependent methyltransferase n=1 Tax=Leptothoe kymatousa TAU-MAC 1615 TaxID=2364775 RepID=A0ABS5Y0J3_9CYAN|nr:class I SAM-dependent methyltransferase [Leptothoe kymatousa]MBT9311343.1 class I SAM-dependent methyltransferase [Leptothoe kymatousa TAU-MAC 1615]
MVLSQLQAVAQRFDREYQGEAFDLPDEIQELAVFRDWVAGSLTPRITSKFWEVAKPKKGQRCLDLGCGLSFLIYPWKEWKAVFFGQDISKVAQMALNQRGPQLDSKLFKGVQLAPAHKLEYEPASFDIVIATGVSCYYPLAYWEQVMTAVKPCLKPGGSFIFDVINPETELAENWGILETYLGADVELTELTQWRSLIKSMGAKVTKQAAGEVFQMYRVQWP